LADLIKLVHRGIPTGERFQSWDSSVDTIGVSDIFRIEKSLGYPAREVTIHADSGNVSFRLNNVFKVYQQQPSNLFGGYGSTYKNVYSGTEVVNQATTAIEIKSGESLTIKGPVKTLEVVVKTGNFRLSVR